MMKRFTWMLLAIALLATCKKDATQQRAVSHGTLTGYDMAMCAVCGGIKIVIDDDTTKNPPPFYRINSTLAQVGLAANSVFPINVTLNWKKDTSALKVGNYIIVSNLNVLH